MTESTHPTGGERLRARTALVAALALGLLALAILWVRVANRGWLLAAPLLAWAVHRWLTRRDRRRAALRREPFPEEWERILRAEVAFYNALSEPEKARFRDDLRIFLAEKSITGIGTDVDEVTRVLAAASAVIPIFGFPEWEWDQISEVLVYPSRFDTEYGVGQEQHVLGMVGSGPMNRMMILSKPDLLRGFRHPKDRHNVGFHEFAHLLDKSDGVTDGIPAFGLPPAGVAPWLQLMHREMAKIESGASDIDPYALTNEAEFFAVVSEYFFENPDLMKRRHPELYATLSKVFRQDLVNRVADMVVGPSRGKLGRNSPCPCGSGRKYKKCCLDERR